MTPQDSDIDLKMDATDLYRENVFTDRRIGSIRELIPVTEDGTDDTSRERLFAGQAQLLTPVGALPLNFDIPANNLKDAIAQFSSEAQKAAEQTIEELKEMRRQAASSIVVPEMGGGGPGGIPGGGIQIP